MPSPRSALRVCFTLTAALLGTAAPVARAAAPPVLQVAAASNLKNTLEALARAVEAEQGLALKLTYGSSGSFAAQITRGAPFDVFLAADDAYPRKLAEAGAGSPEGPFVYALGRLALWVPRHSALDLQAGLQALASPAVKRIALANPKLAPYGQAALEALRRAGLPEQPPERFVLGENVAQAAQFAHAGADAGILPLPLVLAPPLSTSGRHVEIAPDQHPPIVQAGLVLRACRNPAAARALVKFLTGPAGRALLARHGYALPP